MMKKYILLLLVLALVISTASCGKKNDPKTDIGEPPVISGDTNTDDVQQPDVGGKAAEEDAAKKAAEEAARKAAEIEETKKAEEEAAKKAEEAEAARKAAEEEARRKAEEEAARKAAEIEAAKKAEEEAAKKAAEEEAARKAEEEAAKRAAEEEARRKAEEAEAARKAAEEAAKKAEEDAAKNAEEESDTGEQEKPQPPSGGIIVPGFGGIGGGNGDSAEAPVLGDGSGLVADLEAFAGDSTGEMTNETYAITDDKSWQITNWFPGVAVSDGTKFAANTPMIGSKAHVALLIEVPDGVDAADFADELAAHANPRWQICVSAESTQYEVSGNRILFVMSSQEIADAIISAFNG